MHAANNKYTSFDNKEKKLIRNMYMIWLMIDHVLISWWQKVKLYSDTNQSL